VGAAQPAKLAALELVMPRFEPAGGTVGLAAVGPVPERDPLSPLVELSGVAEAVERARAAVAAAHRHPTNRRGWPASAAEASVRAARASSVLDGASGLSKVPPTDGPVTDPVLAGALRAAEALGRLLPVWRRAPLQALARLHVLAAADLVAPHARDVELGRPRGGPGIGERLELLARMVGSSNAPGPVLVAVVHGELLALAPFAVACGVVARAAARLTALSTGFDPKGLAVPEVGHLRRVREYREAAEGFAEGSPEGLGRWIRHCCAAWELGGHEAESIAAGRQPGRND
jgi:hypothetical protein